MLGETLRFIIASAAYTTASQLIASSLGLWIFWRLWSFTILPALRPGAPKELPYWIPVLGHAQAFIADAQSLIDRGKHHFGNSGDPFTLTVGGRKLYILTSPEHVSEVYKNNVTLSWDAMLNELLQGFGVSKKVIPRLWEKLPREVLAKGRDDIDPSKVPHISAIHSTLDLYKRQLLPGPRFEKINDCLTGYIGHYLEWSELTNAYKSHTGKSIKNLSLSALCSDVLVGAVTKSFFGPGIYEIEPDMTQALLDFNQDAWMLVFNYPQGPNSKLNKARKKILAAFENQIEGPEELRAGQAWLLRTVMDEQEAIGISTADQAAMMLMIYWAANINPYKLGFWILSYVLFDKDLHAALKAETSGAYRDGEIDIPYLMTQCPRLDSVYNEALRIVSGALSARKIVKPTNIGGKTLAKHNTILIAFRQLQMSKEAFGEDPTQFDPERFLKDKTLIKSMNFRPFGGGVNYCPGRFLARQEMFMFVTLVIQRFDISLSSETVQQFPVMDITTPSLGINGPQEGMDVFVNIEKPE